MRTLLACTLYVHWFFLRILWSSLWGRWERPGLWSFFCLWEGPVLYQHTYLSLSGIHPIYQVIACSFGAFQIQGPLISALSCGPSCWKHTLLQTDWSNCSSQLYGSNYACSGCHQSSSSGQTAAFARNFIYRCGPASKVSSCHQLYYWSASCFEVYP